MNRAIPNARRHLPHNFSACSITSPTPTRIPRRSHLDPENYPSKSKAKRAINKARIVVDGARGLHDTMVYYSSSRVAVQGRTSDSFAALADSDSGLPFDLKVAPTTVSASAPLSAVSLSLFCSPPPSIYACIYVCMCVCMYVGIYIYIYTYIYLFIEIHISPYKTLSDCLHSIESITPHHPLVQIIYEDDHIAAVHKPPGINTYPPPDAVGTDFFNSMHMAVPYFLKPSPVRVLPPTPPQSSSFPLPFPRLPPSSQLSSHSLRRGGS